MRATASVEELHPPPITGLDQPGVHVLHTMDHMFAVHTDIAVTAGDCVESWHALLRAPTYLPLGTTAHKQGRVASATAVGRDAAYAGSLGTRSSSCSTASSHAPACDRTRPPTTDPRTVDVTVDDHKAYYPGATPLRIRLTGDADGQLLGAQLLGHRSAEVAKRCDIIATAIHQRVSVTDLLDLDLTYTPPLSAPWDPVQQAAEAWETTDA